ncbi:cupin domain-containing protein [Albidovulum sp.]|uniref:cupin domain-containing protein n=1 Tax=Albidovulum sp. TaxID=1872424 RepID=UPI0039B81DC5
MGVIDQSKCPVKTGSIYPEPYASQMKGRSSLRLGDAGGLTQFGAFVETLAPGALSSDRHWHENEDEFLYVFSGEATVIEDDGFHVLHAGDAACWKAGVANGHQVRNRSSVPCSYLVVGTRAASDRVHYSDIDKLYPRENGVVRRTRRDGSVLG